MSLQGSLSHQSYRILKAVRQSRNSKQSLGNAKLKLNRFLYSGLSQKGVRVCVCVKCPLCFSYRALVFRRPKHILSFKFLVATMRHEPMLLGVTPLRLKVLAAMSDELALGYVLMSSLLGDGRGGSPLVPSRDFFHHERDMPHQTRVRSWQLKSLTMESSSWTGT